MDTAVNITVYGDGDLAGEVLREITSLENDISWSVASSEVSALNAADGKVVDAPVTADILTRIMPLCEATNWRLSPFMRPLCALWSDALESGTLPESGSIADAVRQSDCHSADIVESSVRLPSGRQLDLGAFGKGYACDKAAALVGDRAAVIAVGGSVALCGSIGRDWSVAIAVPGDTSSQLGTLSLTGGCFISTSGSRERYTDIDGKSYHHIIDPATGYPADSDILSVTVVCDNGLISDALATAAFIVGVHGSSELLSTYNAEAVFVMQDGGVIVTDRLKGRFKLTDSRYHLNEAAS